MTTPPPDSNVPDALPEVHGDSYPTDAKVDIHDSGNDQAHEKSVEDAEYGDSSASYWNLYGSEAKASDKKLIKTLNRDTNSMAVVNSIFGAIIATFIVQTSQALQPDNSGQTTVCLLSQLVSQGNSTQPPSPPCPDPYPEPLEAAVRSNILLLISFFISMTSVVACAIIQQSCREFKRFAYPRVAPHKRGRVRAYLFQGVKRFYMRRFMHGVHVFLHISVLLFFCGVSEYLHVVYPRVGIISWWCVIASTAGYAVLSVSPLIIGNCPYQTALTPLLRSLLLLYGPAVWKWCLGRKVIWPQRHLHRTLFFMEAADKRAEVLDSRAMKWLFKDNDLDDKNMDKFLEGLPGYIHSHLTTTTTLQKDVPKKQIFQRIREHLLTCATEMDLSEDDRVKRVSLCVDSLHEILRLRKNTPDEEDSLRDYMQSIVEGLQLSCDKPDEIRDLRPFCVRALAFQGFLTRCPESFSRNDKFPGRFDPLYTFFSSQDNTSQTQQQDTVSPPANIPDEAMWKSLLDDGPLINLTVLAEAILLHKDDDPSTLSMCWKTLDKLRSELRITIADASQPCLTRFTKVHDETRRRIGAEEPGFGAIPLLQILDAVAGGQRLSKLFQDHPEYHKRTDLVFGNDHLRNPELFRAFASCLPAFVSKHPGDYVKFMEGLIIADNLWSSLTFHLVNALRPNSFALSTLHVFDTCCTVIDTAFMALENSIDADWRTPDFGSLAHYFELFVTDCFQGMFVERAIGFRVGLIKARFCRAVLAQFQAEFMREGTVIFRSHWDVASLARVFYSLGVGDDADVAFWALFVDGGAIGPEFMDKTYTMLHTAERDGSLLNFCKLGHLGMMAVPFIGSGLEDTDFEKLLALQRTMLDDLRLSLTPASNPVWEDLGRIRDEVIEICDSERSNNKDRVIMRALLKNIDVVYSGRPSSTEGPRPSDQVPAQAPEPSDGVKPGPLSGGLIPGIDSSISATEVRQDSSPAQEDYFGDRIQIPSHRSRSHGKIANVYDTTYPLLPSQIDPSGAITRPSVLHTLYPLQESRHMTSPSAPSHRHLPHHMRSNSQQGHVPIYLSPGPTQESRHMTSPSTPSHHHPPPHMRYNSQHGHVPIYLPPRENTTAIWSSRSATLSSLQSPSTTAVSSPSNTWFDTSPGNGVYSTTPSALIDEK